MAKEEIFMNRPLRVAYLDPGILGIKRETYSINPVGYGGGALVGRYLKEDPEIDFLIFAPAENFENVGVNERRDRCIVLPQSVCDMLQKGLALDHVLPDYLNFDLILHHYCTFSFNRTTRAIPVAHWSVFGGGAGHCGNDYVLLYDPSFRPMYGERAKYVRLGKPVPVECPSRLSCSAQEHPYVVQVTRHDMHMNSIEVAKQCLHYGIKGIFAGPILDNYPLLDYIDGVTTVYLGEIEESVKMDLYRNAQLCALLTAWDPPFNQSIIEAQGQGCPIWVNQRGVFLQRYLKHGINGLRVDGPNPVNLHDAFNLAGAIDPQQCWRAAREYDVSVMCGTFKQAFREIVAEWAVR